MKEHYFTIEVYWRKKWSDRYSMQYTDINEAIEKARQYFNDPEDRYIGSINEHYRIKETIFETNTIPIE